MTRYQQRENFQLWHDIDVKDARIEGIEIATINYTKELIYLKYHIDDLEWINQCNEKQINKIKKLILKDMTYEELKKEINKHT